MTEMNTPGKIAIIHIQRSAKEIEFVVLEGLYIVYMSFDFAFAITGMNTANRNNSYQNWTRREVVGSCRINLTDH